ncbi:MAG: ABC transporter ATP-binding protein [Candidatus Puniceispirillum sp.]|nr:ABC transporter ATP-binding protein [Candidatus Pelagibacter sp.]MBA4283127.1 ABC transporter ATP-binding protein [Candidatus Puniceispirillum sp.]
MNKIAECQNLRKTFKTFSSEVVALRDINLDIYQGEMLMLVGPSGCGKTTLISILAGIMHPDSGVCSVQGLDLNTVSSEKILAFRAKHVGFIFQSFNLIPTLNVMENIMIPLIIQNVNAEEAYEKVLKMLDDVGLKDKAFSSINQLSGGQQQRIAIARSLIHNPSLVICDEPTSALDLDTGQKIMDLMKAINKKSKTTFVIVTHDSRIYDYADRIAYMNDGTILKQEKRGSS